MDDDVVALADAMDKLSAFLEKHAEKRWAAWVAKDAALVRRGDGFGVTHFLAAFAGIGSLSDLIFHPLNHNARDAAEAEDLNKRFGELRGAAWRLAHDLRDDAERPVPSRDIP